jgi:hypothetical protein
VSTTVRLHRHKPRAVILSLDHSSQPLLSKEIETPIHPEFVFPDLIAEYQAGKDELNLAEFPIATLTKRVDPNTKTITSTDIIWDEASKSHIERKVTVTASDKYGLPTALDEEVVLGLLQLSRLQGFRTQEVLFTRYQLLKILGWHDTGTNYQRIEDSLRRWMGVTLYYENAWREKDSNEWKSTYFHILDNVEIYKAGQTNVLATEKFCYFKWNDVVFKSLQAGNLKALDFGVYRQLQSPTAKRLYRFLDKRFWKRKTLEFDLKPFLYKKLGLSMNYQDVSQLKRAIMPAIQELEAVGFIKPLPPTQRFTKSVCGMWSIHFSSAKSEARPNPAQPTAKPTASDSPTLTESRLMAHGVTSRQAKLITSEFPEDYICSKIESLEFILSQPNSGVPNNPAGFLVNSIRENWKQPAGFKTAAEKAQEEENDREAKRRKAEKEKRLNEQKQQQRLAEQEAYRLRHNQVQAFIDSLTESQRERLEAEAMESLPGSHLLGVTMKNALIVGYAETKLVELEQGMVTHFKR